MQNVGLGGSCYWCTEAIFRSLVGIARVYPGWLKSKQQGSFSEGVIVEYDDEQIDLYTIIQIHLHTHSATTAHAFRDKYRSAIYVYSSNQAQEAQRSVLELQKEFSEPLLTKVLYFEAFKPSKSEYHDYYYSDPDKPFCTTMITPKLRMLLEKFGEKVSDEARHIIETRKK